MREICNEIWIDIFAGQVQNKNSYISQFPYAEKNMIYVTYEIYSLRKNNQGLLQGLNKISGQLQIQKEIWKIRIVG